MCAANFLASNSEANRAVIAKATAIRHNLKAATSPPGDWVSVYKARGKVWVCPLILDTNTMVAPNSPILLAKANMAPVMIPGTISGRVTVN